MLGGFTTFSTFTVDVFMDWRGGREDQAIFFLLGSVVFGLAGAAGGYYLGRAVTS